jgi:hypothetical protein
MFAEVKRHTYIYSVEGMWMFQLSGILLTFGRSCTEEIETRLLQILGLGRLSD